MVRKQKSSTRASLAYSQLKSRVQRLDTTVTNITLESLKFWLIKLVKEQSLILSNGKFTACVILKEY